MPCGVSSRLFIPLESRLPQAAMYIKKIILVSLMNKDYYLITCPLMFTMVGRYRQNKRDRGHPIEKQEIIFT